MSVPFRKALLAGALLAVSLVAVPAEAKDVYRSSLDPAIAHHAWLNRLENRLTTPGSWSVNLASQAQTVHTAPARQPT